MAKDVEFLILPKSITLLHLPEGLTKLHTLKIYRTHGGDIGLSRLKLPQDLGKEADWPLMVVLGRPITLQVHKEMGQFSLWVKNPTGESSRHFRLPIRIPAAKDLIRNREPDDDGVFRISMRENFIDGTGNEFTIEVHGVEP